jgi:hypothetical protein
VRVNRPPYLRLVKSEPASKEEEFDKHVHVVRAIKRFRSDLEEVESSSGVPAEPPELTKLRDKLQDCERIKSSLQSTLRVYDELDCDLRMQESGIEAETATRSLRRLAEYALPLLEDGSFYSQGYLRELTPHEILNLRGIAESGSGRVHEETLEKIDVHVHLRLDEIRGQLSKAEKEIEELQSQLREEEEDLADFQKVIDLITEP